MWVGEVYLLHNDNVVPHVELQRVHTQPLPHCHPSLEPLGQALLWPHRTWKLHVIRLRIPRRGGGGGLPICTHTDAVMSLMAHHKKILIQVL